MSRCDFTIHLISHISSWIEFWQRKTRQYVCTTQTWAERTFNHPIKALNERESSVDHLCDEHSDALRTVTCSNKGNSILIEVSFRIFLQKWKHYFILLIKVLKTDLECGWGSGAPSLATHISVLLIFGITFTSLLIWLMRYLYVMYKEFYEILERLYGGNSSSPESLSPKGSIKSVHSVDSVTSEDVGT